MTPYEQKTYAEIGEAINTLILNHDARAVAHSLVARAGLLYGKIFRSNYIPEAEIRAIFDECLKMALAPGKKPLVLLVDGDEETPVTMQ